MATLISKMQDQERDRGVGDLSDRVRELRSDGCSTSCSPTLKGG
jgi:hypothetical protein